MQLPQKVEIIEVGPRDGLQNEPVFIQTPDKISLINALNKTGVKRMEATSFVHPKYVPQMKDAEEVLSGIEKENNIQYMALIPNGKGFERAIANGVKAISLVVAASDTFNHKNVNRSREETILDFKTVIKEAKNNGVFIRYCISTSFWCPFDGKIETQLVLKMVQEIDSLGVDEIVICDTVGRANPKQVYNLFRSILDKNPNAMMSAHFHDTYGFALSNIMAAMQAGIYRFDTSIGGLGGCPFAPGAAGNVATEDVVLMLHEMGISTNIDLQSLLSITNLVKSFTNRELTGHLHKIKEFQTK